MTSRAIANGWPLGMGNPFPVPTIALPFPLPGVTFANTTLIYANTPGFYAPLLEVQQRLSDLGVSFTVIDFGSGPNTGDTVYAALVKLQNWVAVLETPLSITGVPASATQNAAYSFTPAASGGFGTKTFTLTGALSAGLTFSTSSGSISGTPTAAGTTSGLNITVTDTSGSASLGTFSIVVAAAPSVPITSMAITSMPYGYNRNYATDGKAFNADTFGPTWSDDDNVYSTYNDGNGVKPGSYVGSNVGSLTLGDSSLTPTLAITSSMPQWGGNAVTGSDGGTYKSGNMMSVGGVLYMFVARQGTTFVAGTVGAKNAQLLKSTDKGVTWTPAPTTTAQPYTSPMFVSDWASPWFVQYGKDGATIGVDNADLYVYATACGAWNNGNNVILGRCLRSALPNQSAADWTFYKGGTSGDGMQSASWGTYAQATPIITAAKKVGTTGIQYNSFFRRYTMIQWWYPSVVDNASLDMNKPNPDSNYSVWDLYESPSPWGPWTKVQTLPMRQTGYYSAVPNPKTISSTDGSMRLVTAGDYSEYGNEANGYYQFTQLAVALSTSAAPAAVSTNTTAPSVSISTTLGSVLTCNPGVWTGSPIGYFYQWYEDDVRLLGEKSATYTIKTRDQGGKMWCMVTPWNATGTASVSLQSNIVTIPASGSAYVPVSNATYNSFATKKNSGLTLDATGLVITTTTATSNSIKSARATMGATALTKHYFEMKLDNTNSLCVGVGSDTQNYTVTDYYPGGNNQTVALYPNYLVYNNVVQSTSIGMMAGDIVGVAYDTVAKKVWFAVNGVWNGDPAAGTGGVTVTAMTNMYPIYASKGAAAGAKSTFNFGASGFRYVPPSGFVALATPTLNPADKSSLITLSGGNLQVAKTNTTTGYQGVRSAQKGIGKKYVEFVNTSSLGFNPGLGDLTMPINSYGGYDTHSMCWYSGYSAYNESVLGYNGNALAANGAASQTFVQGDVLAYAFDSVAKKIWAAKNGSWINGDPAAGTGGLAVAFTDFYPFLLINTAENYDTAYINLGATDFLQPIPTGFSAIIR